MMKRLFRYPLCLLVALMVACTSSDTDTATPIYELTLKGSKQLTFTAEEQSLEVRFRSTAEWTAQVDQAWCSLSAESGTAGEQTLQVVAETNTSYDERNATLTLRTGDCTKQVLIVQKHPDALILTSAKVELPREGGTFSLALKATDKPVCTFDAATQKWVKEIKVLALNDYTLQFRAEANPDTEKREGSITLCCGDRTEQVKIYQQAGEPRMLLTRDRQVVESKGGEVLVELQSNVAYRMILPEVEWIVEKPERAQSTYTHRLTILPNETYDSRTAEVRFLSEAYDLEEVLTISQLQQDAILVAENAYELSSEAQTLVFDVQTNVEFDLFYSAGSNWIRRVEPTRGLTTHTLTFAVEENSGREKRSATISLRQGDLKQSISILQHPYYESSVLVIEHFNPEFVLPNIVGALLSGSVDWGDGTTAPYRADEAQRHTYSPSLFEESPVRVTVDVTGAEEVEFETIQGIYRVDLSRF